MNKILHVIVVGFHHKRGCQVDFSYPPLSGSADGGLPEEWIHLPSLALPDGAHNSESDLTYFILPSHEQKNDVVFGISCFRQIATEELLIREEHVTRSTVQKSVCVLSRVPLYGVLKAKLQLITQAYFNERDFTKVEVLSQMYTNLCDMFEGDLVDGQAATMDISVRELFITFRHRAIQLFKLMLLERKVVFYISPVQRCGDLMLALASLVPRSIEEGLSYMFRTSGERSASADVGISKAMDSSFDASSYKEDDEEDVHVHDGNDLIGIADDPIMVRDSFGFPMSLFTSGYVFHPYLSISFLDLIRSDDARAYMIGVTNALFVVKRELVDAIIIIDSDGYGQLDIVNLELKRELSLSAADLRFGDFILKNVESNSESSSLFEGGDEWIKLQMRAYLLSMMSTARSGLSVISADFGTHFMTSWKRTRNFKIWLAGEHEDVVGVPPGHAFAGQLGLNDVLLRVEHNVSASEGARRAISVLSSTGKNIGETGTRMRQNISSWFRGAGTGDDDSTVTEGSKAKYSNNMENNEEEVSSDHNPSGGLPDNGMGAGSNLSSKVRSFTSWLKGNRVENEQDQSSSEIGIEALSAMPEA